MKTKTLLKALAAPVVASCLSLAMSQAQAAVLTMEVWVEPDATVDSLADADTVIGSGAADYTDTFSFVDHDDAQGNQGFFTNNIAFPNGGDIANIQGQSLVARVTGNVYIDTAGTYTFGTRNNDGLRLTVGGSELISDSGIHGPQNFFDTDTYAVGLYAFEIVYYEFNNSAVLEFFATEGASTNLNDFALVGDTANGGLALEAPPVVTPVPAPASLGLIAAGLFGLFASRRSVRK